MTDTEALLAAAIHESVVAAGDYCPHDGVWLGGGRCIERAAAILATPSGQRIGERERALEAYDLRCDNFWPRAFDNCIKHGRRVDAEYADDLACWPCRIRVALAAQPDAPEAAS